MEITIRPIRDERDYEAALSGVAGLMDARPGTLDGARLDVMVTLIEAYEASHWAIDSRPARSRKAANKSR